MVVEIFKVPFFVRLRVIRRLERMDIIIDVKIIPIILSGKCTDNTLQIVPIEYTRRRQSGAVASGECHRVKVNGSYTSGYRFITIRTKD